jgi:dihydrolipoamide dehydrogenase
MKQYDLCVIGSGPGGYVAAIRAAQFGKKIIVVEREHIGGVCLNVGCIPSKGMITAAAFFEDMNHAEEMGFTVGKVSVDFNKLQSWKQGVVDKLTGGIAGLFKMHKIDYIAGEAKFKSPKELEVKVSTGGGVDVIQATNFIVANGSRPIEIPGFKFDGKNVLSSTEALALKECPAKLIVIGGGYIGLEIGSFYRKLGAEVTVVEATGALLNGVADPDCVKVVAKKTQKFRR